MTRFPLIAVAVVTVLSACSLAPRYETPRTAIPDTYKEAGLWQAAAPADQSQRGQWWLTYGDEELNRLQARIDTANPSFLAAADRYEQARALAREATGGMFPALGMGGQATRNRQSDNRPLRSPTQPAYYKDYAIGGSLGYELDLWGRVRNEVAVGRETAQAFAADLENVRLSLHAELAADYISLRGFDAEQQLLKDTVAAYERAVDMTRTRHDGGISSGLDLSRAQTQLDTAQAQLTDVSSRRALLEHAIATLVGIPASQFSIEQRIVSFNIPQTPAGLPSTLLQRRPDIAAAERAVAAANSQIGVARAAFFPRLTLMASGGFEDTGSSDWLTAPNRFWAVGPQLSLPIFDAGRRSAEVDRVRQVFNERSENYRAVVLRAFQQVEDNLSLLHLLEKESQQQGAAVKDANHTLDLATNRYREGAVSYLEVVTAQTAALQAQRASLDLNNRYLQASVGLIRALGGGWNLDQLPNSDVVAMNRFREEVR